MHERQVDNRKGLVKIRSRILELLHSNVVCAERLLQHAKTFDGDRAIEGDRKSVV